MQEKADEIMEKLMKDAMEKNYWERCWQEEKTEDLMRYLSGYKNLKSEVIDHLAADDARKAIRELLRITVKGGLIFVSFDGAEPEDFTCSHKMIEPGTMLYDEGMRSGMIFHPYEWEEIAELFQGYDIIYQAANRRNEKNIIIKK